MPLSSAGVGTDTKVVRQRLWALSRKVRAVVRLPASRDRSLLSRPCGLVVIAPIRRMFCMPGLTRCLSSNTKATPGTSTRSSQPFVVAGTLNASVG